jgi:hypothetical protein
VSQQARETAALLEQRLSDAFADARERIPALRTVELGAWLPHATVAAVSLTVFPLLRHVRGNASRYAHAVDLLKAGLRTRISNADHLWAEADRSTVPPTGREQSQTLAEVDEAQALALARWVLIGVCGAAQLGQSWQSVKEQARLLRAVADDRWSAG